MKNQCLDCQQDLQGRADKKFCDNYCRSNYHNQRRRADSPFILRINQILFKNRSILQQFLRHETSCNCTREHLSSFGFQFSYYTACHEEADQVHYFCYDHGYTPLNEGSFRIWKSDHTNSAN